MKHFEHMSAASIERAVSRLREYRGRAKVIAGGTDLLGGLITGIYPHPPEALIDIKTIRGLDRIRKAATATSIGALATLSDLIESPLVQSKYPILSEAARRTASPILRNLATLGGNICQENRCWYYRYPHRLGGRLNCIRKGGRTCYAIAGDNRYHSVFGAVEGCLAVNPGDLAPALVVLDARIRTSKRTLGAEQFFAVNGGRSTVLDDDEIVTEVHLPEPNAGTRTAFLKFALRESIDFAIVNCAAAITIDMGRISSARICLNAVHNIPYRVTGAEEACIGKAISQATAQAAGAAAVSRAKPTPANKYKVQIARTLVRRAVLLCK